MAYKEYTKSDVVDILHKELPKDKGYYVRIEPTPGDDFHGDKSVHVTMLTTDLRHELLKVIFDRGRDFRYEAEVTKVCPRLGYVTNVRHDLEVIHGFLAAISGPIDLLFSAQKESPLGP